MGHMGFTAFIGFCVRYALLLRSSTTGPVCACVETFGDKVEHEGHETCPTTHHTQLASFNVAARRLRLRSLQHWHLNLSDLMLSPTATAAPVVILTLNTAGCYSSRNQQGCQRKMSSLFKA